MRTALSAIRRPEYTGERRCWPCTVVNSVLLAVVCGMLALARRRVAALCVGVGGTLAIVARGYVVPYTPRFAPRLVGWIPGDPFFTRAHAGSGSESGAPSLAGGTDGEAVLDALADAGVLVAAGEELRLDEGFRERWRAEMEPLRTADPDALASIAAEYAPGAAGAKVVELGGMFEKNSSRIALEDASELSINETWLPVPVVIAEVAAVRALDGIPRELRVAAARPLRLFVEECPACGGAVEESTEACCGGYGPTGPDEILVCAACGERLFTFPRDSRA